jgi:bacteriocin-like protein
MSTKKKGDTKKSAELSDDELEKVSGGKGAAANAVRRPTAATAQPRKATTASPSNANPTTKARGR